MIDSITTADFLFADDPLEAAENEVLYCSWEDEEGLVYDIIFTEEGLDNAKQVSPSKFEIEDNNGDFIEVEFFNLKIT